MRTKDVLEGMTILLKYCTDKEGFNIFAEHDVLYFSATDQVVSKQDFDKLYALGWFQSNGTDDNTDSDYVLYDKDKVWQIMLLYV